MRQEHKTIGKICNYYGELSVKEEDGKFFWSIENWDGHEWHEISKELYALLLKHDEELT